MPTGEDRRHLLRMCVHIGKPIISTKGLSYAVFAEALTLAASAGRLDVLRTLRASWCVDWRQVCGSLFQFIEQDVAYYAALNQHEQIVHWLSAKLDQRRESGLAECNGSARSGLVKAELMPAVLQGAIARGDPSWLARCRRILGCADRLEDRWPAEMLHALAYRGDAAGIDNSCCKPTNGTLYREAACAAAKSGHLGLMRKLARMAGSKALESAHSTQMSRSHDLFRSTQELFRVARTWGKLRVLRWLCRKHSEHHIFSSDFVYTGLYTVGSMYWLEQDRICDYAMRRALAMHGPSAHWPSGRGREADVASCMLFDWICSRRNKWGKEPFADISLCFHECFDGPMRGCSPPAHLRALAALRACMSSRLSSHSRT